MQKIADLIVSRRKSIATLIEEIREYESQIEKAGRASPAGQALLGVVRVKFQRLERLRFEAAGFESLMPPANQTEIPGTAKPDTHPDAGPVAGRGRR